MKLFHLFPKKKIFLGLFSLGLLVSALILVFYLLVPFLVSSNNDRQSLHFLRHKVQEIKDEFTALVHHQKQKQELVLHAPFPHEKEDIFDHLKKIPVNPDIEGIGYFSPEGELVLWRGNVLDLEDFFPEEDDRSPNLSSHRKTSFLFREKASVHYVSLLPVQDQGLLAFFRLLAFVPRFKAPYLEEYHFLKPRLRRDCDIDYWDFREDVSGFKRIFSRHDDEYLGQPRLRDDILTLFFPLRDEQGRIIATVTLSSPSKAAQLSAVKETLLLVFYLAISFSLVFLLLHLGFGLASPGGTKIFPASLFILTLVGLRVILVALSKLERIQSLAVFSPAQAAFFSIRDLTKSPADIALTVLFILLATVCLALLLRPLLGKNNKTGLPQPLPFLFSAGLIAGSAALVFIFQDILSRLVFNSNINPLRFSFHLPFILLHLSILGFFLAFFLLASLGIRLSSTMSPGLPASFLVFILSFVLFFYLYGESGIFPVLRALVVLPLFFLAYRPGIIKSGRSLFSCLLLGTLFIFFSLCHDSMNRNRSLVQNFLKNTIISQEHWAFFLMEQSLPEIERKKRAVLSYLNHPDRFDFARSLWESILPARFNWYSSLEILNPEGEVLSRFSLNVPKVFRLDAGLSFSREWSISPLHILFMGKEKDFLVGHKDWFEEEEYLGRTVLYLSLDYNMLPILYSANPYYELLRTGSIPSLHQLEFRLAVFDLNGRLLFNPHQFSSGLPSDYLRTVMESPEGTWLTFRDKNKTFHSFHFLSQNRIYSLFLPRKNFVNLTVEFLKLFFFYAFIFSVIALFFSLAARKKRRKHPLWSFSNRVYASFIAIALIPLLLFSFLTRNFFNTLFSHQFIEKAEVHASFALSILEDFIYLQEEEKSTLSVPAEDLVLWISSTISNDVNLFQDGRLVSSSRREFFDAGLLPDLIDGEIHHRSRFEANPFYTQRQKIGSYSFYTLTIPYALADSVLLISLPFPFERQEISRASEELIEFLVFFSMFFIVLVIIFARAMGTMIITPIKKLLAGTREVGLGNLEIAIDYKPDDEMKTLVDGFNAMVKNLKAHQQELAEMGKKVAWAEMARKVAHEIKNPLTPIQLSAEHLLKVYEDKREDFEKTLKESTSYIISEVENLRKIAQEFLESSRESFIRKEVFDLREIIHETTAPYKKILSERITIKEVYKGDLFCVKGDDAKIQIALKNLFTNAMEAIAGRGEIEVRLTQREEDLVLEIRDTGAGIKKEVFKHIFEPYFSTKDIGTGLGLPITKKIIEDHGGSIQVESEPGEGTRVTIVLPLFK